jgi:AmmeMemoRadiSam system protein B/AmmeMemoRadiSam system protein A
MPTVRPAAVAGMFYPGPAQQLATEVAALLDGVEQHEPRLDFPKALIVPHAGYIYSGPVAAAAYDAIAPGRGIIRRVVLMGPVHRVPVRGLALPGCDAFDTPLGRVPIDGEALALLDGLPQVVTSAAAHAQEHSLEVQLPFLQRVLGNFALLPLAVGDARPEEVAAVLERLWGGRETLFVLSTDLSHYHPYEEARRIDGATVARIARLDHDLTHAEACGATPLNGLLQAAKRRGLRAQRLTACNSGDTAGGKGRVVGYCAFALYEPESVSPARAGATLMAIARAAIAHRLGLQPEAPTADAEPWLVQSGASFVTLKLDGKLRGCIGSLAAVRPLGADVAENAQRAALHDPRFPALTGEEWPRCQIEVSLLTAAKPLRFADEADLLRQIRPGEDGLILEYHGRRGTFLPQVWEGLPEPRRFLEALKQKAGLPADTPLARCRLWRYRVHKWGGATLQ